LSFDCGRLEEVVSSGDVLYRVRSGVHMRLAYATASLALLLITCGSKEPFEGVLTGVAGGVEVLRYGGSKWEQLDTLDAVYLGDSLRVMGESQAEVSFGEGQPNTIRFAENSKVFFSDTLDSSGSPVLEVDAAYGTVLSNINDLGEHYASYRVRTPEAVVQVSGTYFCVTYTLADRNSDVEVIDGEVRVWRPDFFSDVVVVPPGCYVAVPWGRVPTAPERMGLVRQDRLERTIMVSHPMLRRPFAFAGMQRGPGLRHVSAASKGMRARPALKGPGLRPRVRPGEVHHAKPPARAVGPRHGGRPSGPAGVGARPGHAPGPAGMGARPGHAPGQKTGPGPARGGRGDEKDGKHKLDHKKNVHRR
jgi:hypothetical protein